MISKRIQTLAALIPPAKTIADVGCDHGYTIIEAFEKYGIDFAVAIDNKPQPLQRAVENLKQTPYYSNIRFSLSSGLEDLREKVDAIIIAGMGGIMIQEILEKAGNLADSRLILQANRNVPELREYLWKQYYRISEERIVYEDRKYYEIIAAEKTPIRETYTEADFLIGPVLRKREEEVLKRKLRNDLRIYEPLAALNPEICEKIRIIKEYLC
jgi:tRNA (adenine22-N1)-methyltransferase